MMNNSATLYEQDFYGWIQHHIRLLQQRKFAELEIELLIGELESIAKRERYELTSYFSLVIAYLLKWQFSLKQLAKPWQTFHEHSWRSFILERRYQINGLLELSPSLKPHLLEAANKAYSKAVKLASDETGFPVKTFPTTCPYTLE